MSVMQENGLPKGFTDLFVNPGKEYRGTPFWSWNTKLDTSCLEEQIEQFKEMGMGGFYIHTRVGLDTEYMGAEYLDCVKKAVAIAKEKDLYSCLYDEDRWPSGYGGGKVTAHPEYRGRNILITPWRKGMKEYDGRNSDSMASPSPQGNGTFLAAYYVKLNPDGTLSHYERCKEDAPVRRQYRIWYVYLEIAHDSPWFNNRSYVDTLNPEAIGYFLKVTHEVYKEIVGEEFGGTIPSIFTDEPQFGKKRVLGTADSLDEAMLPFTDDFADTYRAAYGTELLEHIPELLWELPDGKASIHRYRYHDHVTERFAQAYSDQVGQWCSANGICLAGHMMEEPTLQSQTQALGEVMRSLRGFSLPGVDMLCDAREYTTVKQAESVCHQYGRAGVVSELYGVTNWDFDFRRHKLQGDWQAVLGVTHRVHHLNWMSMAGEAKRDYPAAIGFQSPWYREYGTIETHFARVNSAMRRGRPVVRIGVIHPIESYWILFGPNKETGQKRQELDKRFQDVTEWLLFGNQDFDYISESLLPQEWDGNRVGRMRYDVILVPGCLTIRGTTLAVLDEMKKSGMKIIFMGEAPALVDAGESDAGIRFAETCCRIEFARSRLMDALEEYRLVDIRFSGNKHLKKPYHKKNWNGERTGKFIYQMREEADGRWLFIANGRNGYRPDLSLPDDVCIEIDGQWDVTELDTMNGEIHPLETGVKNGRTVFGRRFYEHDSLLLHLTPAKAASGDAPLASGTLMPEGGSAGKQDGNWERRDLFLSKVQVIREEPNVLILDLPEYEFGDGITGGPDEILRVDNKLRENLKLPLRRAALAQPWTQKRKDEPCPVVLKYKIICGETIENACFAAESLDCAEIFLDGCGLGRQDAGRYFVDPCIKTVELPPLNKGEHELLLNIMFTGKVNLETCYLLGDFDVEVHGSRTILRKARQEHCWGSLTEQGMPFYGGNAVYQTELELDAGIYMLEVSKYRAPLLEIRIDGEKAGQIIKAPYRIRFGIGQPGKHVLGIKSFGNRVNTFGAIHDCDEDEIYFDPDAWRTVNESWSYEYQLKKAGILKAPVLYLPKIK